MPLITAKDAAERLGISAWQLYSLAKRKLVPSVKLGRSVRFDAQALEEFIRNGGTRAGDAHHE